MRQDRIVQLLVTNIKRPEKLGFSSGPKLIALINTFKSNKKRAHWMVQSCSHPLLSNLTPPWINSRQLELVLTNTLEHTQTNTHTHTLTNYLKSFLDLLRIKIDHRCGRISVQNWKHKHTVFFWSYHVFFDPFRCVARAEDGGTRVFHHRLGRVQSFCWLWVTFLRKLAGIFQREISIEQWYQVHTLRHCDGDESGFSLDIMDSYSVSFGRSVIAITVIS